MQERRAAAVIGKPANPAADLVAIEGWIEPRAAGPSFSPTHALFGAGAPSETAIDRKAAEQTMAAHGMIDPIEQQIHFACLRRAIAQAHRR